MAISRGEKKLVAVCAFALAIPLGVAAFFGHINKTPIVNIPAYPRAPKPNGYDLYLAAANSVVQARPSAGTANDPEILTDPKIAAQRYGLPRKEAWLAKNSAGFALFDRALKTPTLAPPERSMNLPLRSYARLRELGRNKLTQSDTFWMRGDASGALQSGLDVVQMGHDIRRGGGIMDTLVGSAIGAMGRAENVDAIEKLDAAQAKRAARRIEKLLETRWTLAQALTEEKYSNQASWQEIFKSKDWRASGFDKDKPLDLLYGLRAYTISNQRIMDDFGAISDRKIANARLPYANEGAPPLALDNPFVGIYQSIGEKRRFLRFSDARDLAGDQLLMLQLALRAFRLETGAYPDDLKSLTPRYLNAIPADPFGGGESWHYGRKTATYALWSIGPDGKDDGGAPIPWNKPPRPRLGERKKLPGVFPDAKGDVVAGKNR